MQVTICHIQKYENENIAVIFIIFLFLSIHMLGWIKQLSYTITKNKLFFYCQCNTF